MALNPPLTPEGPMPIRGEYELFVLEKKDVSFEINIENHGTLTGSGSSIITSTRVVLINSESGNDFKAFELPLLNISNI